MDMTITTSNISNHVSFTIDNATFKFNIFIAERLFVLVHHVLQFQNELSSFSRSSQVLEAPTEFDMSLYLKSLTIELYVMPLTGSLVSDCAFVTQLPNIYFHSSSENSNISIERVVVTEVVHRLSLIHI